MSKKINNWKNATKTYQHFVNNLQSKPNLRQTKEKNNRKLYN